MSFSRISPEKKNRRNAPAGYLDAKRSVFLSSKSARGTSGWIFDLPLEENLELSTDITDHVTEDQSFVQDHVVRQPKRITLRGEIAELVFSPFGARSQAEKDAGTFDAAGTLEQIQNRLGTVEAYIGDRLPGAVQKSRRVVNTAQEVEAFYSRNMSRAENIAGFFQDDEPTPEFPGPTTQNTTRQRRIYNDLKALWLRNEVVEVMTPWEFFDSMLIEQISAQQDEDTTQVSEITITLKEYRAATVARRTDFNEDLVPPREEIQSEEPEDGGTVQGEEQDDRSLLQALRDVGADLLQGFLE